MIRIASLSIAGALLACGLSAAPAQAQADRTWVSGKGTDAGVCALAAPCRTFAFALNQTAAGGEIDVLDPADYGGKVTITKAISIVNDGVGVATIGLNSVNGNGGAAIRINAGPSDNVHLRGLIIEGLNVDADGIDFFSGGTLAIEDCVIRNFNVGIVIFPSTSSSFSVSNTIVSNNRFKAGGGGIFVQPSGSAVVTGVLSKVIMYNNGSGIAVRSAVSRPSLNVTIVDSVASNNNICVEAAGNAATAVMVRNSVASNNGIGLEADTTANLRVAHSVVTGNGTGVSTSGGTIFSYGDNDINGNTNNNTGVLTPLAMH